MNIHADKAQENKKESVASDVSQKQHGNESTFQLIDNRPEAVAQRKLQEMANNNSQAEQIAQLQTIHQQQVNTDENDCQKEKTESPVNNGKAIIQRVVEPVLIGRVVCYRSTLDPERRPFATSGEAKKHEDDLIAAMTFPSYRDRAPTAFTFAQTHTGCTIGDGASKQGPHVFAEVGMNRAFGDMGRPELAAAVAALPTPADTHARFDVEMADMSDEDEREARIDRFDKTYRQLYGLAQSIDPEAYKGAKKTKATNARRNVLKMAANMSAYGTYSYQEEDPYAHPDWRAMIAGKGERADAPAAALYDSHADDFVKDKKAFKKEKAMRIGILGERK